MIQDPEKAFADAGITILERAPDVVSAAIETSRGTVLMVAGLVRLENRLVMDRVHITGEGLTIGKIRHLAKVFGQVEDVEEVIIQGGDRMSGAKPGSSPTPIRVRVK